MSRIVKVCVLIIFLMEVQFFYMFEESSYSFYNTKHQKLFIVIFTCIVFYFLYLINLKKEKKYLFNNFIIFFLVLSLYEILRSLVLYNQGLKNVILESNYILLLLNYYIFTYYMKISNNKNVICIMVIFVSFVVSLIFLIQANSYETLGLFINVPEVTRFTALRITEVEGLINVSIIISFSYLLNNNSKHKFLFLLSFIICLTELIFVQKTRIALLAVFVTCLILLFSKYVKKTIYLIVILSILSIVYVFFMNSVLADSYIDSFNNNDMSLIARQQEISFYTKQILENPLFGMGFIRDNIDPFTTLLLRGEEGYLYRSDVGIIGFTNAFGLIGAFWFLFLLISIAKKIYFLTKRKIIENNFEILGLFIFIILTIPTLIIMDVQRIFGLIILLSILDFTYSKNH